MCQFPQTISNISLKAKSYNYKKYANIVEFLDAYVNNNKNDIDKFKKKKWTN